MSYRDAIFSALSPDAQARVIRKYKPRRRKLPRLNRELAALARNGAAQS